jgi:Polyketide cyclase / dehydrase and lipid transport
LRRDREIWNIHGKTGRPWFREIPIWALLVSLKEAHTVKLETHAEVVIPKPPEAVFDFSIAEGTFARVLRPFGPIPGIESIVIDGGGRLATGTRRQVTMTDKSIIGEEVLLLERPREHRYRWLNRPAPPFSYLVKGGEASWTFHAEASGTRIRWDYTFELTSPLAYPAMLLVTAIFRRWMQQGLRGLRDAMGA